MTPHPERKANCTYLSVIVQYIPQNHSFLVDFFVPPPPFKQINSGCTTDHKAIVIQNLSNMIVIYMNKIVTRFVSAIRVSRNNYRKYRDAAIFNLFVIVRFLAAFNNKTTGNRSSTVKNIFVVFPVHLSVSFSTKYSILTCRYVIKY